MSVLAKSCVVFVLTTFLAAPVASQRFLEASPDVVSRDRVVEKFRSVLGHGQTGERLALIQDLLRPTVMALPRDSSGSLEHRVARYALYRHFLVHHGLRVKGLSLEKEETNTSSPATMLKSRMPSFIMELLEEQRGSGRLGLEELAVVAATVEDLVRSDAVDLLELAYQTLGLSTDEPLDAENADLLIRTFVVYFLLPQWQQHSQEQARVRAFVTRHIFRAYPGWVDTVLWVKDVRQSLEYQDRSALRPFIATDGQHLDFTSMAHWATAVSAGFGRFLDVECKEMKNKMLDLDQEREDGRVGLAKFYAPLAAEGLVWFSESPAYLKHLGALDEENPGKPSAIVTNLLYGDSNCMASSGFHMACCIDSCEALMAGLEQQLSQPVAAPAAIAGVVSAMPSDTVAAPRNLSAPLRSRLDEIAGRHGGSVPLHSRLFAQWMHYAFPNECPFPRSLLTSEPQLTSSAWEANKSERSGLSRTEAQEFVDMGSHGPEEEQVASDGVPLLWSEDEELLSDLLSAPKGGATSSMLPLVAGVAALAASALEIHRILRSHLSGMGGKPNRQPWLGGASASTESRTHFV